MPSVRRAGATITSTFWNSLIEEYPVMAIARRSPPKMLVLPSSVPAGPRSTSSSVPTGSVRTRVPRGSTGWCDA